MAEDFYHSSVSRTGTCLSGPMPDQGFQSVRTDDMFPLPIARTCEMRFPAKAGIPGIWDTRASIVSGTCAEAVCSSLPKHGPGEPTLVSGCYTGAFYYTDRLERPRYGLRLRTRLTGRDFRDPGVCLRHHTTG